MTKEQFFESLRVINQEFKDKKIELYKQYAYANNTYKVGEIFKDHIGKVRIEKIGVTVDRELSSCTYWGAELRDNEIPYKKGTKRMAYQINEVRV